jgi:hypothetical protein
LTAPRKRFEKREAGKEKQNTFNKKKKANAPHKP